jgi:crotonobetaine/carnitine-CoA ligase
MINRLQGSWQRLDQVVTRHADQAPEAVFAERGDEVCTYGELERRVNMVRDTVLALGVRPGEVVAIMTTHQIDYTACLLGTIKTGAVANPVSSLLSADELGYQLSHAAPKVVFHEPGQADRLALLLPDLEAAPALIEVASSADGPHLSAQVGAANQTDPPAAAAPTADDLAIIMYTSGTTARPKGVMLTHGNLMTSAIENSRDRAWTSNDRFLHYFPMYHASGGFASLAPPIYARSTLVFVERFSASRFSQQLAEHRITFTAVNSTHVRMIMNQPRQPYDGQHSCARMQCGLQLEPHEVAEFEELFATSLFSNYGMTESIGSCIMDVVGVPTRAGAIGRVRNGYEIALVDDDGADVPVGTPGEVIIKPLHRHFSSAGYYKDPDNTAATFQEDGIHSGDLAMMDDDGFFWFVGRKKDMIKRSGFNLAPAEVERVVDWLPEVRESAVVGIPDPFREEAIVAFVVLEQGQEVGEETVIKHCGANLADYKVPSHVLFVDDLPKNFVGKVEKRQLRTDAIERLGAS